MLTWIILTAALGPVAAALAGMAGLVVFAYLINETAQ